MARRHGVQYASTVTKQCWMSDDACAARIVEQLTARLAGIDAAKLVEERCGRYVSGKRIGKLRGQAEVVIVTEGGWQILGPGEGNGRVVRPGTVLSIRITDFHGKNYLEG